MIYKILNAFSETFLIHNDPFFINKSNSNSSKFNQKVKFFVSVISTSVVYFINIFHSISFYFRVYIPVCY